MNQILEKSEQTIDIEAIRDDFTILKQKVNGHPLVYLDNAATSQKPRSVLEALDNYYCQDNANVHRGVHALSDRATDKFEKSRDNVCQFLNARRREEIVWTRGTTEGINLVAQCYAKPLLKAGDVVLVSAMEHHSNIVPWQMVCEQTGASLQVIPVNERGEIIFEAFESLLNDKVKMVAVTHVSNALGTINPIEEMVQSAHKVGAKVLVDGAQAASHLVIDVQKLNCDFYAFSGHKVFGPTGIGALYGRESLLESMLPYQGGGEMIKVVSFSGTTYNDLPYKFEAGTPNIAGAIGLSAAIDYLNQFDRHALLHHEDQLLAIATERAEKVNGLSLIGTAENKTGVMSFIIEGTHPNDVGTLLDQQGVAVRTGHHCAMPIMEQFELPGTIRVSLAFYNNLDDIEKLFKALDKALKMLV